MGVNAFEDSRIAAGTLGSRGQKPASEGNGSTEASMAISRDDVRDGAADAWEPRVVASGALVGDRVRNPDGEYLGRVREIMLDVPAGRVAYAVLSFGGFLGVGDKLFAVPWGALRVHTVEREFILEIDRETLENAPGFDKDDWPDMADPAFREAIDTHYGGIDLEQGATAGVERDLRRNG